jgi:hypothetical protein
MDLGTCKVRACWELPWAVNYTAVRPPHAAGQGGQLMAVVGDDPSTVGARLPPACLHSACLPPAFRLQRMRPAAPPPCRRRRPIAPLCRGALGLWAGRVP